MNNKLSWFRQNPTRRGPKITASFLTIAALTFGPGAYAGTPDWLWEASRNYSENTSAVTLLNEQATTISGNGEIKTRYRCAYKILRTEGRKYATVIVDFDDETRLTSLKAWSLPATGEPYELRAKDVFETGLFRGILYQDTRRKMFSIPGADPGNVIGYEYEQRGRPAVLQDSWLVSREIPVRRARYSLRLPGGWEVDPHWVNHSGVAVRPAEKNRSLWELENIPAIETEPAMPHWRTVASRLLVGFYPRREDLRDRAHRSWDDVGRWYGDLTRGRRAATPEIREKVAALTQASPTLLDKIKVLASFAQQDIRYVAIEIGIGGYQPRPAREVFGNRYGDCKDKATLLGAMLREVGVESHYVLVHSRRGAVVPEAPAARSFNHVITAVELPAEGGAALEATYNHDRLGRLLFFDPTDPTTPFGHLRADLQAGYGLLVAEDGGQLVELPLLPPSVNRLLRSGKLSFTEDGSLRGGVREIRWGGPAISKRGAFLQVAGPERQQVLEDFLGSFLGDFQLRHAVVHNLETYDLPLVLDYKFIAAGYAKTAGKLLLFKPWVMGIYLTQVTTRCRIGEMEDYPRNLAEFEARFATEQACREYLCQLRWPEGFRCPRCGHDKAWAVRTALLECAGCGHQASPTAGTIFQDTRQPLQSWFRAMWWLTSQKNGASALGLQRVLGLGSYKTAWTWLHKLRRAMVRPGRDRLSGRVEVDETYLGGLEEGVRGRQTDAKALIVVAAEEDGAGIGRVRIRTIPNASGDSLMAFVGESIEPGSVVHTDGWLGYEPLEGDGYRHEVSYLEGQPARASKLLPRVHRVVSLVKRWILGTHQGAVSHEHLDSYLDEFAFRFNRRKSRSRGKLFYRLVQQAVAVPPAPYKSLVGGTATRATDDHNM